MREQGLPVRRRLTPEWIAGVAFGGQPPLPTVGVGQEIAECL